MKKILLALAATALVLTVVGISLACYWLYLAEDDSVAIAENAIAQEGLFLIGHVDSKKIRTLYRLKYGEPDPSPLPSLIGNPTLVNTLLDGKAKILDQIDQVVVALRIMDRSAVFNLVINGNIVWADLKSALEKKYSIEEKGSGGYILTQKSDARSSRSEEEFECPEDQTEVKKKTKPKTYALVHAGSWVVVSSDLDDARLVMKRIEGREKATVDIERWRDFRKGKLVAAGMLDPDPLATGGMGMMGLLMPRSPKGAEKKNPVRESYVGASVNPVKPGLRISSDTVADAAWATTKAKEFEEKKTEFIASTGEYSATLASLAENLSVSGDGDLLRATVDVPHDLIEKIPEIVDEAISSFLSKAFSGMGAANKGKADQKPKVEDQIDEHPWDYSYNNQLKSVPDFRPDDPFLPRIIRGGYGYGIDKIAINKELGLLEIELRAKINLPKVEHGFWMNSGLATKLWINDVLDMDGVSLLRDERCVKDLPRFGSRNQSPQEQSGDELQKTIRLIKGVDFQTIKSISGKVELSIPTNVQKYRLAAKPGSKLDAQGVRVYVRGVEHDSVSLELSGNTDKVIEIRGINQEDKPLHGAGWSGSGTGGSQHRNVSFRGGVKQLDIFIAAGNKTLQDDFVLDVQAAFNPIQQDMTRYDLLEKPGTVSLAGWNANNSVDIRKFNEELAKKRWDDEDWVGVFVMAPMAIRVEHDKDNAWNYKPEVQVTLPFFGSLLNNFNFVEVLINPLGENGAPISVPLFLSRIIQSPDSEQAKYVAKFSVNGKGFISGYHSFDPGLKQGEPISAMKGSVVVRLPQKIREQRVDLPRIGTPLVVGESQIALKEIDFFMKAIKLEYLGPRENFISILMVTGTGEIYNPERFVVTQEGVEVWCPIRNNISHLLLLTAEKQETITYPFDVKIDYSQGEK